MTQEAKAIRQRYHEAWNAGDPGALDSIMTPDVVNHSPLPGQPDGIAGFKGAMMSMRAGVPDLTITIESSVAEGDKVSTRWTGTGTHAGSLMGIPATGKRVTVSGIDICRVADGYMVEYWQELDTLSMLQQLGVIPS